MNLPLYWEGLVYGKAMGWINLGKAGEGGFEDEGVCKGENSWCWS